MTPSLTAAWGSPNRAVDMQGAAPSSHGAADVIGSVDRRDLFPLPAVGQQNGTAKHHLCRTTLRRLQRRGRSFELAQEMATTLNELYAGPNAAAQCSSSSLAQRTVVDRLVDAATRFGGPPSDLTRQGALEELLAKQGYAGESAAVAPLDVDRVALPPPGFRPVPLSEAAGAVGRSLTQRLLEAVLSKEDGEARVRELGLRRPYSDPAVRQRPFEYGKLIRRLHVSGLVKFRRRRPKRIVGLFVV